MTAVTTTTVVTNVTATTAVVQTREQTTTAAVMTTVTTTTVAHSNATATVTGVSLTLATDHGQTNNREKDRDTETKNAIHVRILQKFTSGNQASSNLTFAVIDRTPPTMTATRRGNVTCCLFDGETNRDIASLSEAQHQNALCMLISDVCALCMR